MKAFYFKILGMVQNLQKLGNSERSETYSFLRMVQKKARQIKPWSCKSLNPWLHLTFTNVWSAKGPFRFLIRPGGPESYGKIDQKRNLHLNHAHFSLIF